MAGRDDNEGAFGSSKEEETETVSIGKKILQTSRETIEDKR